MIYFYKPVFYLASTHIIHVGKQLLKAWIFIQCQNGLMLTTTQNRVMKAK